MPYTYQFWMHDAATMAWTNPYSGANDSFVWTPTSVGSYSWQVWVQDAKGDLAALNAVPTPFSLTSAVPSQVTLQSSAATHVVGVPEIWTATGTGGTAPLSYRFLLWNESTGQWSTLRDYSTENTVPWTPAVACSYLMQVWVRSAGSAAAFDAYVGRGFSVTLVP